MSNNRINILLAFASIYIIWGSTYVALRFGIETIPPFLLSATRFFIAGILLFGYCLLKRKALPDLKSIFTNGFCGVLVLGGGTISVAWAEQYVPSSIAAILVTFVPFWFVLLDKKQWGYYFSNKIILVGILLGFIGVSVLTLVNQDTATLNRPGNAGIGVIAILAGGISWTVGSLLLKYKTSNASLLVNGSIQMLATAVASLLISFIAGELNSFSFNQVSSESMSALFYLTFMGSLGAYLSYIYLLSILPAVQVSTYVYINPLIAVLLGVSFANEQ